MYEYYKERFNLIKFYFNLWIPSVVVMESFGIMVSS
jgi:hypothetical protein